MAADTDGSAATTSTSSSSSSAAAFKTFRALVDSADRKFARVRDLPPYGSGLHHHQDYHHHYHRKVFKAYTRLWKFQQENRSELLESGLRRWEIGEIASRIGQLYYSQYLRTSEVRFLLESYVFYEAILSRGYFEAGKEKGLSQQKPDLGVRSKELRFYARFVIVALLLNRMEVLRVLVEKFRALVEDCRVSFPGTNFKEWKQVVQEIVRFLKVESGFTNTRPLRYNVLLDSNSSSHSYVTRFRAPRVLRLRDALLTSYRHNEVKFTELTLDTFRMLQCLEWEPSGSFYQMRAVESSDNGVISDQSAASGLIDINLAADMTDPCLPPNPRKAILYRPSSPHLIAVTASICEELSADSIMLIYISASGKSDQDSAFQKKHTGTSRNSSDLNAASETCHQCDSSLPQPPRFDKGDCNDCCGGCLWLGSRGRGGQNSLYPADLIPFTRRPLFLIIDSDNSLAFKVVHGAERGETAALLLSHRRPILQSPSAADLTLNGSQFTFFLTAPLQAFYQLVGLSSDIEVDVHNNAEKILSSAFSEWEVTLCTSDCLDQAWAQVLPDPFLRRLILRFIFCRSVLSLFRLPGKGSQYLPVCVPNLPESVSPDSSSVQSSIRHLAESLGVTSHFHFVATIEISTHEVPL